MTGGVRRAPASTRRPDLSALDDADLVARLAAARGEGGGPLLAEVARRHGAAIRRAAADHVDAATADDVVQDVLLRLLDNAGAIADGGALRRWLVVVARNRAVDLARAAHRRHERPSGGPGDLPTGVVPAPPPASSPALRPAEVVEARVLSTAILDGIAPADAALLRGRYVEDRSLEELAAARGVTVGSIRVLLHRSRERARRIARERGLAGLPGLEWLRRHVAAAPQLSEVAAAALGALAVVGGLSVLLPGGGDEVAQAPPAVDARPVTAPAAAPPPPAPPPAPDPVAAATAEPVAAISAPPAAAAAAQPSPTPTATPERTTITRTPTIPLPLTDRQIDNQGDPEPAYVLEIPAPVEPIQVQSQDADDPLFNELFGQVCQAAGVLDPLVTCLVRDP